MGFGALRSRIFHQPPPPISLHSAATFRGLVLAAPSTASPILGTRNDKPRRKRASLKPPGPYSWVEAVAGETLAKPEEKEREEENQTAS